MAISSSAQGLVFLVISCLLAISQAETIIVGGSEGWRYGYNYTDWSLKHSPFYVNDTLVFKYAPPGETVQPHNVYLLPNLWSFIRCDFRAATPLANATQGDGEGFAFVFRNVTIYYLASGEGNGDDCRKGKMKFFALPLPR